MPFNIEVVVRGRPKTGKSWVMLLVQRALGAFGIRAEIHDPEMAPEELCRRGERLDTVMSEFHEPGPRKKFRAFQLTASVMVVSRVCPFASWIGTRLSPRGPTWRSTR